MKKYYSFLKYLFTLFVFSIIFTNSVSALTLSSQSDVNNYGGSSSISGDLIISGPDISYLDSLYPITNISGKLKIFVCGDLVNFEGLNNLVTVGGDVEIFNLVSLLNFEGLNSLTTINGNLMIGAGSILNQSLESLNGLSSLDSIGGTLEVRDNNSLLSLEGLSSLRTINYLEIDGNDFLTTLGLSSLETTVFGLDIGDNNSLIDLIGLENLENLNGNIEVSNNANLQSFVGLSSPSILEVDLLLIYNNSSLIDLSGLESLTSISSLIINSNENLENLNGLNNCSSLGSLWLSNNDSLQNLIGLEQISAITGSCKIEYNQMLNSFVGLNNVDSILGEFTSFDNYNLNSCQGLNDLVYVGGLFRIRALGGETSYMALKNFEGLENLNTIGEGFYIQGHDSVENFNGLEALTTIGGVLTINDNNQLGSLEGLDNINPSTITDLDINNNAQLSQCNVISICEYIATPDADYYIADNNVGCNNASSVSQLCFGGCLVEGIIINSQEEIDNFSSDYLNCSSIGGDVYISGNDIVDLSGLSSIKRINGIFEIAYCDNLLEINGMDSLNYTEGITIHHNNILESVDSFNALDSVMGVFGITGDGLETIAGFENLKVVGGGFVIEALVDSTDLVDFDQLNYVGGLFRIEGDYFTENFNGFESLQYIGGDFQIFNVVNITAISGFTSLDSIGGSIEITFLNSITELPIFQNVKKVNNDIIISDNDNLMSLPEFNSLVSVGGNLEVEFNELLVNLDNLDSLEIISNDLIVTNNASLENIDGLASLQRVENNINLEDLNNLISIEGFGSLIYIGNDFILHSAVLLSNLDGLEGISEIQGDFLLGQTHVENVDGLSNISTMGYSTQIINNYFLTDISGFSSLTSLTNLEIDGGILPSLNGLNSLDSVMGSLKISGILISTMEGLENLTYIGAGLTIEGTSYLLNLDGLDDLSFIGLELKIYNNLALLNLDALNDVEDYDLLLASIYNNPNLSYCANNFVCELVDDPALNIYLIGNDLGCNTEEEIIEDCEVLGQIFTFYSQEEVDNFPSLCVGCSTIIGSIYIEGQDITNLDSLSQITSVSGDVTIGYVIGNPLLLTLGGLDNLLEIGGYLSIENNPSLLGFEGIIESSNAMNLSSLSDIGGDFLIAQNASLENLMGLESLSSIDGDLIIEDNISLTSLTGIENLDYQSIDNLYVQDNPVLSTCHIQTICNYISNPNGLTLINNNDEGCNSSDEVYSICSVGIDDINYEDNLLVFPNPATTDLYISNISLLEIDEIKIVNQMGQIVIIQKGNSGSIDISQLTSGLYFVEILIAHQRVRQKIIKK